MAKSYTVSGSGIATQQSLATHQERPAETTAAVGNAPETGRARKGFLTNVGANVVFVGAQVLVNLWLTPFLIGHLGIAAFGMIQLVITVVSYMSILTTALDSALSRFVAIDLGRWDVSAANKTFNSALFGLLGIIAALSPVIIILSLYFSAIFGISPGWERDSSWLFLLIASSFLITVLGGCFSVSCLVHSRFLFINLVNLLGILARVGLILALYTMLPGRLWYVGGASLCAAVVVLTGFVYLWRRLTPELHIRLADLNRVRLGAMANMGSWVMVNMVGAALLGRVDLLVVNAFFGSAVTGGYASVAQFSIFMEYLVNAASTVIRPIILIKYAQEDWAGLQQLAAQSVKLLGLALGLPVGLLCGFAPSLLTVWLGPSYAYLAVLLIIIIFHHALNLSVRPLLHVQNAYNKVRWPGIATLLSGLANLGLAILLARWGGWAAVGVAVATAIAWTAKNGIYMPIYTAHAMNLRWWTFMPHLIASMAGTALAWGLAYGFTLVRMPDSWLTLGASAAAVSFVYILAIWAWGLNGDDRALLQALIPFQITVNPPSLSITSRKG